MIGAVPMHSGWFLAGAGDTAPAPLSRVLPGEDRLAEFADLLGEGVSRSSGKARSVSWPCMLPPAGWDMLLLQRSIPFSRLGCDLAALRFSLLLGEGDVFIDDRSVARFCGGPLEIDLTPQARARRDIRIGLCFTAIRPAGIHGAVTLRCARSAALGRPRVNTGGTQREGTVPVRASRCGDYLLRIVPADWREPLQTLLRLDEGESRPVVFTLPRGTSSSSSAAGVFAADLYRRTPSGLQACDHRAFSVIPARADAPA